MHRPKQRHANIPKRSQSHDKKRSVDNAITVIKTKLTKTLLNAVLKRHKCSIAVCRQQSSPQTINTRHKHDVGLTVSAHNLATLTRIKLHSTILSHNLPVHNHVLRSRLNQLRFRTCDTSKRQTVGSVDHNRLGTILLSTTRTLPAIQITFSRHLASLSISTQHVAFRAPNNSIIIRTSTVVKSSNTFDTIHRRLRHHRNFSFDRSCLSRCCGRLAVPTISNSFTLSPNTLRV